jgi:hypothetical protein
MMTSSYISHACLSNRRPEREAFFDRITGFSGMVGGRGERNQKFEIRNGEFGMTEGKNQTRVD